MGKTAIEYADMTVNPLRAKLAGAKGHYCEKISPGCRHCYASALQRRFRMPEFAEQRRAEVEHELDASALRSVLQRKKPTRYFWCDMSDMFGAWVPNEWIAACFGVMAATPWHTHLVFTKRAERLPEWFRWIDWHAGSGIPWGGLDAKLGIPTQRLGASVSNRGAWNARSFAEPVIGERMDIRADQADVFSPAVDWPLRNAMLIVSAEDQPRADERIPHLLATPAAWRGVSLEPLLGRIDLSAWLPPDDSRDKSRLDWVVVGGESGHEARDTDLACVRSIVAQCADADVPCYVKQLGARPVRFMSLLSKQEMPPRRTALPLLHPKGGNPAEWPQDVRVRQFPEALT